MDRKHRYIPGRIRQTRIEDERIAELLLANLALLESAVPFAMAIGPYAMTIAWQVWQRRRSEVLAEHFPQR
jgi:D-aminopeptidase